MKLMGIARETFLFASSFRNRLAENSLPEILAVEAEASAVLRRMDQMAEGSSLDPRYKLVRYGLIALIDEVVMTSDWKPGQHWQSLEGKESSGRLLAGTDVYREIESLQPADKDLAEVWFYILALGFKGKLALPGKESEWEKVLARLHHMVESAPIPELKLTENAYDRVEGKAPRLDPMFKFWRAALVFVVGMVLMIFLYNFIWHQTEEKARIASENVVENLHNGELKESIQANVLQGEGR